MIGVMNIISYTDLFTWLYQKLWNLVFPHFKIILKCILYLKQGKTISNFLKKITKKQMILKTKTKQNKQKTKQKTNKQTNNPTNKQINKQTNKQPTHPTNKQTNKHPFSHRPKC